MLTRTIILLFLGSGVAGAATQDEKPKTTAERLDAIEAQLAEQAKGLPSDETMRVYWKDGLRFETADKRYKFRLGGRMHYDIGFFDPDTDTKNAVETTVGTTKTRIEDGSEFRRARIEMSGEVGDRVDWAASYDFANSTTNFRNLYAGVKDLCFGNLRAGQFKEPYGLEQITSSNHLTFMERSLMNAFVPAYNAGLMAFDAVASERITWAVGAFRTGTDNGEVSKGDGEWATTARLTGLPYFDEDGSDYVHLGVGVSRRSPTDDTITFSTKPEANLAPSYLSIAVPAETYDLIGAEAAWVEGSFLLQGEYTLASVDAPSGVTNDPDFSGYYVQASWILTGENRPYRKANGCFDAIKPEENAFGKDHGRGAWEVAARYSSIDLTDDGLDEGTLTDITFGVNWYLNPNTRVMANYILADLEPTAPAPEGDTDILELRVQFNF